MDNKPSICLVIPLAPVAPGDGDGGKWRRRCCICVSSILLRLEYARKKKEEKKKAPLNHSFNISMRVAGETRQAAKGRVTLASVHLSPWRLTIQCRGCCSFIRLKYSTDGKHNFLPSLRRNFLALAIIAEALLLAFNAPRANQPATFSSSPFALSKVNLYNEGLLHRALECHVKWLKMGCAALIDGVKGGWRPGCHCPFKGAGF